MTFIELAVETARYHNRMAVRASKWFCDSRSAELHRKQRDKWIVLAKNF